MKQLFLRQGHDRRIRSGHPWIFSNEIDRIDGQVEPGDAVQIRSASGEVFGVGYYNPRSLIAARLLGEPGETIDSPEFFRTRLQKAADYRNSLYGNRAAVRLVYGEADGLPGLVVDRYNQVLVVQFLTLGMEQRREAILAGLNEVFQPEAIVARNNVAVRELEGLPQEVEVLQGELPDPLIITEHGLRFHVDVLHGQKTGHFLDQKENHQALKGRVENRRVLDLFCYSGSWSIHAARFGAREVTGVDISRGAVDLAGMNARLNFQETVCSFLQADVFELLKELQHSGERYGTVILDPPAFVKNKKRIQEAIRGYLTINRRAMELLEPGGYLFTCSCSHHLDRETFLHTLTTAARQAGRPFRLMETRGQAYDHPVLLNCPETEYLKCIVLQAV
ncbi:MAG: class I SAM-dependent rRNA methyltransferase [Syntrophotaleaceae bacterium]